MQHSVLIKQYPYMTGKVEQIASFCVLWGYFFYWEARFYAGISKDMYAV